jgi:integrase/recombinase XerD
MKPLVSPIASQIERFLQFKRALGCRYQDEERQLEVLDRFLASRLPSEGPVITDSIIRAYVKRGSHRLTILRQFCRFIALEEPRTFIPPPHFLGISRRPFVPRILTRVEGRAFLKACLDLPSGRCSPLRGMVHGTVLALLYLTGMRVGEALSLNSEDVDLSNGVIKIKRGKFGKSRFVPMAQDLTDRINQCKLFVDRSLGIRTPSACFFPGPKGSRCTKDVLRYSFRMVLTEANIPYLGAGKGPRLHDLRHAYAIHRMMLWYEQGAVLGVKLPILATYLGHVSLLSSQYYLRLTEDLLAGVLSRYETRFGALIEERRKV